MEESKTITLVALNLENNPEEKILLPATDSSPRYKYNYNLQIGDKDDDGNVIKEIYAKEPGKYLIYSVGDYKLHFMAEDGSLISNDAKFNKLLVQVIDYMGSMPSLGSKFTVKIAFALRAFLDGNSEIACESLTAINDNIIRHLKRLAVFPYLAGAFSLVLISLMSYFVAYRWGDLNEFGNMMFQAVILAALGGFLSVAISLGNISVDIQDTAWHKTMYGFVRIMIAMISGVVIYFLIEGKVAIAFLKDIQNLNQNLNLYYLAFFVSGFSEKLISNLMLDFEKKGSSKDK